MKPNETCVSLFSLSLPSVGGAAVPPAVGDEVDITATATIDRIEGDKAYLKFTTINDAPVESAEPAAEEMSLDDEEAEMRTDAKKTDRERGGLFS